MGVNWSVANNRYVVNSKPQFAQSKYSDFRKSALAIGAKLPSVEFNIAPPEGSFKGKYASKDVDFSNGFKFNNNYNYEVKGV